MISPTRKSFGVITIPGPKSKLPKETDGGEGLVKTHLSQDTTVHRSLKRYLFKRQTDVLLLNWLKEPEELNGVVKPYRLPNPYNVWRFPNGRTFKSLECEDLEDVRSISVFSISCSRRRRVLGLNGDHSRYMWSLHRVPKP